MEGRIINKEPLKAIHDHLNRIYTRATKDYKGFLNRCVDCRLDFFKENYLHIDGQYRLQHYPIPIISVNEIGDIGYNLDQIFFEFALEKKDFLSKDLSDFINHYNSLEIYGGHDCLIDFNEKNDTPEMIRKKVQHSDETIIMLSVYFDYACDSLIDTFIKTSNTLKNNQLNNH